MSKEITSGPFCLINWWRLRVTTVSAEVAGIQNVFLMTTYRAFVCWLLFWREICEYLAVQFLVINLNEVMIQKCKNTHEKNIRIRILSLVVNIWRHLKCLTRKDGFRRWHYVCIPKYYTATKAMFYFGRGG